MLLKQQYLVVQILCLICLFLYLVDLVSIFVFFHFPLLKFLTDSGGHEDYPG